MPETATEPVEFHFREGAGRLCLDFVRTLRHRGKGDAVEELSGPEALAAWVRQCGPVAPERVGVPAAEHVPEALALREAVHRLIQATREGGEPGHGKEESPAFTRADRERVNAAAAHPVPVPELSAEGHVTWRAEDPVTATLALVARDALDLATSPLATRVRACAGPLCGALFLDNSRPGTRRWCSMDTCGNRAKKESLRGRTARAA